jgi:hypothetical protein
MALGCGSADAPSLFGDRTGGFAGDAPDAQTSGGRGGSSGGAGSVGGDASSDGGSTGADGGSTGADGGASSTGGTNSAGGASSSGGDSNDGGTGGTSDAGGGLTGSGGDCQPTKWCRDRDGDGHGDPNESKTACIAPGTEWKAQCDDCRDGNARVHPDAECREDGYTLSDGVTLSFDYDCDGHESECADFVKADADGCGPVGPLNCAGSGYLPNPDRSAGAEQNSYCGSTAYRNCVSVGIPCVSQTVTKAAVACH